MNSDSSTPCLLFPIERREPLRLSPLLSPAHHRRVLRIVAGGLSWWMLLVPAVGFGLLWSAAGPLLPWFVGKYSSTGKDLQELIGPSLLAAAVCVASFQAFQQRQFWFEWLAWLAGCLLLREWHFPGTSTGVYLGLLALAGYGSLCIDRLLPFVRHRSSCVLLTGAATAYAIAISTDHGAWKFLPHWQMWSINFEETLESAGHALILMTALAAGLIRVGPRHIAAPARQSQPDFKSLAKAA
jgi:hypothetical protein